MIAISTDTHFTHWMWKKTSPTVKNVEYPMAGDPSGAVSKAYGVWQKSGLNRRGRFIINPDGYVMAVEVLTGPVGRNIDETIRQIKAMQEVAKHSGKKAAPSGWKPGDELIGVGKEFIGVY